MKKLLIILILLFFSQNVFGEVITLDEGVLFSDVKLEGDIIKIRDKLDEKIFRERTFLDILNSDGYQYLYFFKKEKSKIYDAYLIDRNDLSRTIKAKWGKYQILNEGKELELILYEGASQKIYPEDKSCKVIRFKKYEAKLYLKSNRSRGATEG